MLNKISNKFVVNYSNIGYCLNILSFLGHDYRTDSQSVVPVCPRNHLSKKYTKIDVKIVEFDFLVIIIKLLILPNCDRNHYRTILTCLN